MPETTARLEMGSETLRCLGDEAGDIGPTPPHPRTGNGSCDGGGVWRL
jgi:hypothetical protein